MSRKLTTKLLAVIIGLCVCISFFPSPARAAMTYYNSYTWKGGFLWLKTYTGKVYRDSNWFSVFWGNASVSTGFDYKNNVGVTLSQTRSFTIGKQTKKSLSAGVDFSGWGVPAKVGGSIDTTDSFTWGISNTSVRTVPDSAPRGYYSYNVCINTYKINIKKYEGSTYLTTLTFFAPRSQPYRSIVYNPNNADYSGVIRY